jgi:hypothetical protein
LRYRKDRRPTLPREHPLVFYSHYLSHLALMQLRIVYWALRINRVRRAIKSDAKRLEYMDLSLTPSPSTSFTISHSLAKHEVV